MPIIRTFIALEIPANLQKELDKISVSLQRELKELPLRWVRTENIHLTLKFIGETPQEKVDEIAAVVKSQAANVAPFEIALDHFGVFPDLRKPLVLWVGVQAPQNLAQLQHFLEAELAAVGFPAEQRKFSPHLTLARVRRDHRIANLKRIGEVMARATVDSKTVGHIDSVTLFRSDMNPGGSVYNPLSRSPLTGQS